MAEMEPIMADVSAAAMVNARALAEEEGAAAASVCRALHKAAWVSPSDDRTAVLAERSVRHIPPLRLPLPLLPSDTALWLLCRRRCSTRAASAPT